MSWVIPWLDTWYVTLIPLRTDKLFSRLFLNFSTISSWLLSDYAFLSRIPQKCSVLLNTFHQEAHDDHLSLSWWCLLQSLGQIVLKMEILWKHAKILFLIFFFFSNFIIYWRLLPETILTFSGFRMMIFYFSHFSYSHNLEFYSNKEISPHSFIHSCI